MGIFDNTRYITKPTLRDIFKKPASLSFSGNEKEQLEKDIFTKKHGSSIDKSEFHRRINELADERYKAKTDAEKSEINKRITLMKEMEKIQLEESKNN